MNTLALYDEVDGKQFLDDDKFIDAVYLSKDGPIPKGHFLKVENAIFWTQAVGETASKFILNTKAFRIELDAPKLMKLSGNYALYTAIKTEYAKGTLPKIRKIYILIEYARQ